MRIIVSAVVALLHLPYFLHHARSQETEVQSGSAAWHFAVAASFRYLTGRNGNIDAVAYNAPFRQLIGTWPCFAGRRRSPGPVSFWCGSANISAEQSFTGGITHTTINASFKRGNTKIAAENNFGAASPIDAHAGTSKPRADGWTSVGPKSRTSEIKRDVLCPAGWSVPVLTDVNLLDAVASGVFLATKSEGVKLCDLRSSQPLAVLLPGPLRNSREVDVLVTDGSGRTASRRRHLVQLGPVEVPYECSAEKRTYTADTDLVVVTLSKKYTAADVWTDATNNPTKMASLWLRTRAEADVLQTRPATKKEGDDASFQVVATVSKTSRQATLKASGRDGVFVRPFYLASASTDEFTVVPLKRDASLSQALQQSAWLGEKAQGLVCLRHGLAVRVLPTDKAAVVDAVCPDERAELLGKRYEVTGLPAGCGRTALIAFLSTWTVTPVYTYLRGNQRTWVVSATEEPLAVHLQHDEGVAVVRPAGARTQQKTTPTLKWQPPKGGKPLPTPTAWAKPLVTSTPAPTPRPAATAVPTQTLTAVQPYPATASALAAAAQPTTQQPDLAAVLAAIQQIAAMQQTQGQEMSVMRRDMARMQGVPADDETDGEMDDDELQTQHPDQREAKHRRLALVSSGAA